MKPPKDIIVNVVLLFFSLIALLMAALSANCADFVPAPKRTAIPQAPVYKDCSPYTGYGELCVWRGGIEIPLMSTGPSQFTTMATLVLPPTNDNWDLYQGDFNFSLDYVYLRDCKKNVVTYKNTAWLYKNDSVCN